MKKKLLLVLLVVFLIVLNVLWTSKPAKASWVPLKKGGSQRQQDIIAYAWGISQDWNWIATLEAENGTWEELRVGVTGDRGLCQLNPRYHWAFINSEQFKDYKYQLLYCAEIYARASAKGTISTTFYGWNHRERTRNNFIWFNN